ncbi:hypothetical protein CHH69_14245 [Terribacillus saccharophilus]|uniref:hypothetical protein n=1 Tax=Terribacillus saccharophilus TaxID=361277 RepID=UPI000BA69BE9|nr:hypothetical protein [Terribacillus saccharophilus]PAF34728.1 hypothetical protein CHH69_14245 [Terribacillus saccharophilus]
MADIIDMDQVKTKKCLCQVAKMKGIEYEIYLTVVKYIDKHTENVLPEYAFKTTASGLSEIYNGNRKLFLRSYYELLRYWDIPLIDAEIPANMEFERYPKIGDLCYFIDRKIQTGKYTS